MNVDSRSRGAREVWLTQFKSICEGDVWSTLGMKEGTGKSGKAVHKTVTITDFFVTAFG